MNHNTPQQEIEALDFLIGPRGDSVEQHCRRRRTPKFITRLDQVRAVKSTTAGNLEALKQGKPHTEIFQSRFALYGVDFILATDIVTTFCQYECSLSTNCKGEAGLEDASGVARANSASEPRPSIASSWAAAEAMAELLG